MTNGFVEIAKALEATQLSEKTLERFITAGYIKSTKDENNDTLIDIDDIRKTFGVEIASLKENKSDKEIQHESRQEVKQNKAQTKPEPELETAEEATSHKKTNYQEIPEKMLGKVAALQDRLLDEKDATIKSQIKEIEWLRGRIEKLESQGEKDKVLLLSSNQTINELIKIHHPKRGFFHRALSWVIPDEGPSSKS